MKLTTLEVKNYKAHKHYIANFNNENKLIQGSKGSGKTSLQHAFYWIMTGRLVDDPTPVDEHGVIINGLTISAKATFEDGSTLQIESNQKFNKKGEITARHNQTFYIDSVPVQANEYQTYLDEKYGTLVQRRTQLDPTWFAYGDGLKVTGRTPKSDWQVRREMVIQASGSADIEASIKENDDTLKKAKFALSRLKKGQDDVNAGIESLHNAKHDVSHLSLNTLKETLSQLNKEKESSLNAMNSLDDNERLSTLRRALSDAQTTLSSEHSNYMLEYNNALDKAQAPLREYHKNRRELEEKLSNEEYAQRQQDAKRIQLLGEIQRLEKQLTTKLNEHSELKNNVFIPDSTICNTCQQPLPANKLVEAEARFNQDKSARLEAIVNDGSTLRKNIETTKKELETLNKTFKVDELRSELSSMVEPTVKNPVKWEETDKYKELSQKVSDAKAALESGDTSDAKDIYKRAIDAIDVKLSETQDLINLFSTNDHLENQIETKAQELQEIASEQDKQKDIIESCNKFTRKTLDALDEKIRKTFPGLYFKMFEYTLDGDQKDTCKTYGETEHGFIPWENLSGGQKRSATIKLANAFKNVWNIEIPLFIDDTQIYSDDELIAEMQLIRITEVPYAELEVK